MNAEFTAKSLGGRRVGGGHLVRCPAQNSDASIFGAHAVTLKRAGLAVIPAKGKRPIRRHFDKMKHAPGLAVVEKWVETNANDNIVYIPGLSRTPCTRHGLVVVDADNAVEVERAEQTFGRTPAMIDTRRGRHFIYAAPDEPLGNIGSLRGVGMDIDIKHGQKGSGVSVAPPSRHPDQHDFVYAWHEGSGPEALTDLPAFNVRVLYSLLTKGSTMLPNVTNTAPPPNRFGSSFGQETARPNAFSHLFRDGSRKLGLNDYLVAHAWAIEDFDACLDIARAWNHDLNETWGVECLPDSEAIEVCKTIMADIERGKLVRTRRQRAIAITDADEVRHLLATYKNGDAALALLLLLRAEHGARCLRGESFAICARAMVEARTMGTWAARKYREARDMLLHTGLIEPVSPASRHVAAQYRLAKRLLTSSGGRK